MQGWLAGPLLALAAMLGVVAMTAGLERLSLSGTQIPASTAVSTRLLRVQDEPGGAVGVYDSGTGRVVAKVTGQAGFFRIILRGLAQKRNMESLPEDVPFRITQWADGRITLDDPLTRRHVELAAFGPTNEAVFAKLLRPAEESP